MSKTKELDEEIHSIARYIAGLGPMWSNRYAFEKKLKKKLEAAKQALEKLRASYPVCPFCEKRFKAKGGYVLHLIKMHRSEIAELIHVLDNRKETTK